MSPIVILDVVLVLLVVGIGATGFLVYGSAARAYSLAQDARASARDAADHLKIHDFDSLYGDVETLFESVEALDGELSDRLWDVAARLPGYGQDVANARALVGIARDLSAAALPAVDGLRSGGDAGTAGLLRALSGMHGALSDVAGRVEGLSDGRVGQVNELASACRDYLPMAAALSGMLGSGGSPRTYLVLPQSNVEARSTGGFFGSWGSVTIDDGEVSLGDFSSRQSVVFYRRDVGQWFAEDEVAFLGTRVMGQATAINVVPDFSHVGMIASHYWELMGEDPVDGAIALDPVLLQYVLEVTGGVTTSDGTVVDGSNAARAVLFDVYTRGLTHAEEDEFFVEVAQLAFERLMGSLDDIDLGRLLAALRRGADEGRLMLWSADAEEERELKALGLAGEVPDDPMAPQLGVYANNWGWSKIEWYLDMRTDAGAPEVGADGSSVYRVETTLRNAMTEAEDEANPLYLHSQNRMASSPSAILDLVLLVGPEGGTLTDVSLDGVPVDPGYDATWDQQTRGTLYGKDAWQVMVDVPLGQTRTLSYTVTTAPGAAPLAVRQTALAQDFG